MNEISENRPSTGRENGFHMNDLMANNVLHVARMDRNASTHVSFGERVAALIAAFCGNRVFV